MANKVKINGTILIQEPKGSLLYARGNGVVYMKVEFAGVVYYASLETGTLYRERPEDIERVTSVTIEAEAQK